MMSCDAVLTHASAHSHAVFVLSFTLVYLEQTDNQSDPKVSWHQLSDLSHQLQAPAGLHARTVHVVARPGVTVTTKFTKNRCWSKISKIRTRIVK